ncbi:hypothetical protein CFC21_084539 [Triticum aestivum]|uniref:Uncharacterized protein n=2 Tax=Triticum aestivum TaxID=4565 RepID=A0A9R1IAA7_WHEAT|nr:hypothetical protein CFC21_084539 [Triticum aestivum]
MMRKLVAAMLLVLVATSGSSWYRAAARPLQGDEVQDGEPSSGGIALPSPTHWRGHVLSQLEEKGPNGCPKTHNHTTTCPPV